MFGGVPSRTEIVLLPLVAIAVMELIHTRENELELFFLPFLTCVFRFVPNQLRRTAAERAARPAAARETKAIAIASGLETFSLLPLLLLEVGAVVACSPSTPLFVWIWVIGFYATYLALRLVSRRLWQTAFTAATS